MPRKKTSMTRCREEGCDRPAVLKGLCRRCYMRRYRKERRRALTEATQMPADEYSLRCSIRGCAHVLHEEGLCVLHLTELLRAGKRGRVFREAAEDGDLCAIRDCKRPPGSRGVCIPHQGMLAEMAESLPDRVGRARPAVRFRLREVRLGDIDLSDRRFSMREDLGNIADLAASIARMGILQNVILWEGPGEDLVFVAGERRLHAAALVEAMGQGPVVIRAMVAPPETPEETLQAIAAHENLKRDGISHYEMALLTDRMRGEGLDFLDVANRLGVSMETSMRYVTLLKKASLELLEALHRNRLSFAHARIIWARPLEEQPKWVGKVVEKGWSRERLNREISRTRTRKKRARARGLLKRPPAFVKGPGPRKRGPYPHEIELADAVELEWFAELVERIERRRRGARGRKGE